MLYGIKFSEKETKEIMSGGGQELKLVESPSVVICKTKGENDDEEMQELIGLRIYAQVVGLANMRDKDVVQLKFISGNPKMQEIISRRPHKGMIIKASDECNLADKLNNVRYTPIAKTPEYKYKNVPVLHGTLGMYLDGQVVC